MVKPFYEEKSKQAQEWISQYFGEKFPYFVHRSEGALFLWIWFEGLPIPTKELYQRLKERSVLVVPGEYFFFGLPEGIDWGHARECIRMTYTMPAKMVEEAIEIIAEEVEKAFGEEG